MKISFLGTGAAEGFPAAFCACEYCKSARKIGESEFRTRSQVLIDDFMSIDFPPDAYAHSLKFGVDLSALKYILVTHSHMDHFYAHDFILHGYKYAALEQPVLNIYGNGEILKVYSECTRRELKDGVAKTVSLNVISPFSTLTVGGYRILTLPAIHATAEEALLYYVEKGSAGYLHLYDTGALSDQSVEFLKNNGAHANLIAFDCTFLSAPPQGGTRHMCLEDNKNILNRLIKAGVADGRTKCVVTHFSHNSNPLRKNVERAAMEYGFIGAYDGLTLEI